MIERSKVSLTQITLTYKNETIELTKDPETKQWTGKGKIGGITAAQMIGIPTA